jgi:hypothetical protein
MKACKAFIPALLALAGVVITANSLRAQSNAPNSTPPNNPQHPQGTYDSEHRQKPLDPQHPERNQPKEGTYNNTDKANKTKQPAPNPDQKSPNAYPDGSNAPSKPHPRVPADDKTPKSGNSQHRNVQKSKSNQPVPPGNK